MKRLAIESFFFRAEYVYVYNVWLQGIIVGFVIYIYKGNVSLNESWKTRMFINGVEHRQKEVSDVVF